LRRIGGDRETIDERFMNKTPCRGGGRAESEQGMGIEGLKEKEF